MTVRFTTTGPAGPSRGYQVYLVTGVGENSKGCYPEWESLGLPIKGGVGRTYTVTLDSNSIFDEDTYFCTGRALLVVRTRYLDGVVDRPMRKISFRILPPGSG
jgi:hypothetical protein